MGGLLFCLGLGIWDLLCTFIYLVYEMSIAHVGKGAPGNDK